MDLQNIKKRFSITGNSKNLERAIEKAIIVAPTDISVLVTGESGVGKEHIPKIIHQLSKRKHKTFIAINCGAIPEGTIDSELFGHEKGAFTGALNSRSGFFESCNGGTIFLDELGELPLPTQTRLLRVLENGEYFKVGSSEIKKTDIRVIGATNVNLIEAIKKGKFREDLYYRLNTVEINIPPLRERGEDIHLLFRKFASEFAEKYNTSPIKLDDEALESLLKYRWYGNIRQLKNITEQMSIFEIKKIINKDTLNSYLPDNKSFLPSIVEKQDSSFDSDFFINSILSLKEEVNKLKKIIWDIVSSNKNDYASNVNEQIVLQNNKIKN